MSTSMRTAGELSVWRTPKCYAGFDPVGHIVVLSRHRNSSILDASNWYTARHRIEAVTPIARLEDLAHDGPFSLFDPDKTPIVYDWRVGDSLVGWIEYLMIRPCMNAQPLIAIARDIAGQLDAYPILDESDYSERQVEAMENYWKTEPLSQRVKLCKEHGVSIFEARRDYVPSAIEQHWSAEMFA